MNVATSKRKHTIEVRHFSKNVSECVNNFKLDIDHKFVDLTRVTQACVNVVEAEVNSETTDSKYRVPPLVLMRFARGGKTITLASIFDQLKKDGKVNPIMISFNGSGPRPFKQCADETASQVILRLIASQLIDCSDEEALNLVVDRTALDIHLGDNVVLLIDELNNLNNLDEEAAALLRELFLDRAGRYLVFTSHYPVSIEANANVRASDVLGRTSPRPSNRGIISVNMSLASSLNELRGMSDSCAALTEEEAAWLGNIPSLVYCTKSDSGHDGIVTPSRRFEQMHIPVPPYRIPDILQLFVSELLTGERVPAVSHFYASFQSVGENSLVSYPLCYAYEIFNKLNGNKATVKLITILKKLESHLGSKYSGLAWECTVQVAIILRMLYSHWSGAEFFDMVPYNTKPHVAFETLPDDCDSLADARERMNAFIARYTTPTIIYVDSASAKYPCVECFAIYTANGSSAEAKIMGFQMKTSDVKPRQEIDLSMFNCGAVLVRGRVKAKNPREPKHGWKYMTSAEVRMFIGNSLLLAMPRDWLRDA